jgi:hypothetical protein
MKTLTCAEVEELLDLFAADECDPLTGQAIRAHDASCPRCTARLAQAREFAGLLDLQYRHDDALARLQARIQREVDSRPRLLRFPAPLRRFASLAALVLVTFGLGLWLAPAPGPSEGQGEPVVVSAELAVVPQARAFPEHRVKAMRAGPEQAKEFGPKRDQTARVDLEGKSPAQWQRQVEAGQLPPPPRIPVQLTIRNPGSKTLHVDGQTRRFVCLLDLRGPAVLRRSQERGPFTPLGHLTLPPGGAVPWRLERLWGVDQHNRREYLYPTAPGDYSLRVTLRVSTWEEGQPQRWRPVILKAGPIALRVEEGH